MGNFLKNTKEEPIVIPNPEIKPLVPKKPEIIPMPEKIEPFMPHLPEAPPIIVPDIEPFKETYNLAIRKIKVISDYVV